MAYTLGQEVSRIAGELKRSNIDDAIKFAINDAIVEAARTRFYFNEMRGLTFNTVVDQEYYPDLGFTEIDAMYYFDGVNSRRNVWLQNDVIATNRADGSTSGGQINSYSRYGMSLRLYPIPSTVFAVYMDGFGRLSPYPLAINDDTNEYLGEGENYIRALAKRNVYRDQIRDLSQASIFDAVAEDYKTDLIGETNQRQGTGTLYPTRF